MPDEGEVKIRGDGELDNRGHGEGSKSTRFKPGDGRPRPGRRKGSRDERTIVLAIRDMPVVVKLADGRKRKITTPEAILLKQRQKALGGDLKAAEFIMKRIDKYEPPSTEPDRTRDLMAEDAIILDVARRRGLLPADPPNEEGDA